MLELEKSYKVSVPYIAALLGNRLSSSLGLVRKRLISNVCPGQGRRSTDTMHIYLSPFESKPSLHRWRIRGLERLNHFPEVTQWIQGKRENETPGLCPLTFLSWAPWETANPRRKKNAGSQICLGKSATLPWWYQISAGHADREEISNLKDPSPSVEN